MNKIHCLAPALINYKGRKWLEQLLSDVNLVMESSYHHTAEVQLLRLREHATSVLEKIDHSKYIARTLDKMDCGSEMRGNTTGHLYTKMSDGTWMSAVTGECNYSQDVVDMEPGGFS